MYTADSSSSSSAQDTDSGEIEQSSHNNNNNNNGDRCYLPKVMDMPKSPDGTYTPPSPHSSLVRAVAFASNEEYQDYCKKYDSVLGAYTDEWKYNENNECGNWQERYTNIHKTDLERLEEYRDGKFSSEIDVAERPKFISYLCKEVPKDSNRGCGGLADRMGGKF
jgi:hypothetical protein